MHSRKPQHDFRVEMCDLGVGSQPWIRVEVGADRVDPDLSIDPVKALDAQLPIPSQLLGLCHWLRL